MKIQRNTILFIAVYIALVLVVQLLISMGILSNFWSTLLKIGAVMSIVCLGLNLIYGFNGQFSLGQWGFYAIGAYSAADITYRWTQLHSASGLVVLTLVVLLVGLSYFLTTKLVKLLPGLDFMSSFALYLLAVILACFVAIGIARVLIAPVTNFFLLLPETLAVEIIFVLAVLLAGLVAAEVSYIYGMPVLTLGSDYFGIATLGFTVIVKVLLDNSDTMFGFTEMKGARGMVGIPKLTSWMWVAFFLLIIIIVTRNLLQSSHGRAMISVREDEIAAKAMGINISNQKTITFVLGSLFAGIAGGLYAHVNGFLHPNTFNFIASFNPLIIIVLGGLGSVSGTVLASVGWALILEGVLRLVLPEGFETWRFVVYPILLLLMMLLRPQGIFGTFEFPFLKQVLPPVFKPKNGDQPQVPSISTQGEAGD